MASWQLDKLCMQRAYRSAASSRGLSIDVEERPEVARDDSRQKKEPKRPAEGPRRSGFPCPPPQLVGKNRVTRRVRHRAGTRTVRLPPPRRTCLPLLNGCAGYVPSNARALGLPG